MSPETAYLAKRAEKAREKALQLCQDLTKSQEAWQDLKARLAELRVRLASEWVQRPRCRGADRSPLHVRAGGLVPSAASLPTKGHDVL